MDFLFLAQVVVGVLLAISGVAKLRDREATADAFTALRLPSWLRRMHAPEVLPWAELALAAGLVLGAGWLQVVAAAAVLVLMVAYTAVIGRALGFDEPVRCGCFGALGAGDVTATTLVRNVLLVVLAALGLVGAVYGVSAWGQPLPSWGWVAVGLLSAAAVALSLGGSGRQQPAGPTGWVQHASLTDESTGASVRVADLARTHGGATLLFVLPGCGACARTLETLPSVRRDNPGRFVVPVLPGWATVDDGLARVADLHRDPGSNIATALGMSFAPAALEVDEHGAPVGSLHVGGDDVAALLGASVEAPEPEAPVEESPEPEELDYVRRPIPEAVLLDDQGTPHTLHELVTQRAALLVAIDCRCTPARQAMESLLRWQEQLPVLDVRLVPSFRMPEDALGPEERAMTLYDHGGFAARRLNATGQVSAVLLGADGLLAGGPVSGIDEVVAFVDDIAQEIAAASEA